MTRLARAAAFTLGFISLSLYHFRYKFVSFSLNLYHFSLILNLKVVVFCLFEFEAKFVTPTRCFQYGRHLGPFGGWAFGCAAVGGLQILGGHVSDTQWRT